MTNEEAIMRLEALRALSSEHSLKTIGKAIDMAIDALSVKPIGEPLTLEQLLKMDGKPVWVKCLDTKKYTDPPIGWRIVERSITGTIGVWNGESCFAERDYGVDWLAYAYHPAHIDLEAWTAEWENHYRSGVHAGTGAVCSSCDVWNGRKTHFCPFCGKAMTPEALAMLEKRLRGYIE